MTSIVRRGQDSPQLLAVNRQVAQQMERMQGNAEIAKAGMEEISEIYTYSEYKAVNALVTAELYRKAFDQSGGTLTILEARAYLSLRQQYLNQMAEIAQIAGADVVRSVAAAPHDRRRRSLGDLIFGE